MQTRILFFSVLFCFCAFAQHAWGQASATGMEEEAIFVLVRHAEKARKDAQDPLLTKAGKKRALRLAALLKNANVSAVFSTPYQRTRLTAEPTANAIGQAIQDYDPRSSNDFAKIRELAKGKTVLIVGHSNTIPTMANQLLGEERFSQLDDKEYDKIFVISRIGEKATAIVLSY